LHNTKYHIWYPIQLSDRCDQRMQVAIGKPAKTGVNRNWLFRSQEENIDED
jgi:hypothetical protein